MTNETEQFKEMLYYLMIGAFDLENYPMAESQYVENEYEEGNFCAIAYEEVFNAKLRICERLGIDEDNDVEIIINNLLDIGRHLSMKMYDYGVFFSSHPIKTKLE